MCKTIEQYYNQNFDIDTTKIHNINISTRIPCVLLQPYLPPSCPHHLFITWQSVICSVSIILSFKGCYINPLYICMCVCVYVCVCIYICKYMYYIYFHNWLFFTQCNFLAIHPDCNVYQLCIPFYCWVSIPWYRCMIIKPFTI